MAEPVGWLESPHGAFRANPLYKIDFPSQLLEWRVPLYTAPQLASCLYPECVDNGPEGKCTRWLVGECPGPKVGV